MKVLFNSEAYSDKALKGIYTNAFMATNFKDVPEKLFELGSIEVLKGINADNGNSLIILQIKNSDIRVLEFDSLIEELYFLETICIFKLD